MMSKSLPGILPFEHAAELHPEIKFKLFREKTIVLFHFTLRKTAFDNKVFTYFLLLFYKQLLRKTYN